MENKTFEKINETHSEHIDIESKVKNIKETIAKLYKRDEILEIHEEIGEFAKKLKSEHPQDIQNYALYHAMIGSSPRIAWSDFPEDKIDLPEEEHSIEKFIKSLEKKYKDK